MGLENYTGDFIVIPFYEFITTVKYFPKWS